MLFNVYLLTVLVSTIIELSHLVATVVKLNYYGYKMGESLATILSQATNDNKIKFKAKLMKLSKAVVIFTAVIFSIMLALLVNLFPILNIVRSVRILNNWNDATNSGIKELLEKSKGLLYNKYDMTYDEILINKDKLKLKKMIYEANKKSDIVSEEMIEALYLDGATKKEIKLELLHSKKQNRNMQMEEKNAKALSDSNDIVDNIELNIDLSPNDRKRLLNLYKNALLNQKKINMAPINATNKISEKGFQKTKRLNKI